MTNQSQNATDNNEKGLAVHGRAIKGETGRTKFQEERSRGLSRRGDRGQEMETERSNSRGEKGELEGAPQTRGRGSSTLALPTRPRAHLWTMAS